MASLKHRARSRTRIDAWSTNLRRQVRHAGFGLQARWRRGGAFPRLVGPVDD